MDTKNSTGHKYKDSVLRLIYLEPKRVIELYNALENKNYKPTAKVEYFNIEDKLLGKYGDIFCTIENELFLLSEHMSTDNFNMPMRMLQYAMDGITTKLLHNQNLHSSKLIKMPTPKFYLLYNGKKKAESLPKIMKLSDAFILPTKTPALEVIVNVIDIRHSSQTVVLQKSPTLSSYAYLIHIIESYIKQGLSRDKSISLGVNQCINENTAIADFLEENYRGVIDMLGYEYTLEDELYGRWLDGKEEGRVEGEKIGVVKGKIERDLEIALNLLKKGVDISFIATTLEKPIDWVENILTKK